jgi:putative oxidoreductase
MFDAFAKNALVPLVLRFALAVTFIYHGQEKVLGQTNEWGSAWMKAKPGEDPLLPTPAQLGVAWGELLGGAALALGFLTRLAALGIIVIMAGAIHMYHGVKGFSLADGGYEYNFAIIAMCLALILSGGGTFSMDRLLWRRHKS